jgi:hypothetical protein
LTPKFSLEKDELKQNLEKAFDNKVPVRLDLSKLEQSK